MSDAAYSDDWRFEGPTKTRLVQEHRDRRRRNMVPIGTDIRIVKDTGINLRVPPKGIDGYRAAYERQEARKRRLEAEKAVEKLNENSCTPSDAEPPAVGPEGEPVYLMGDIQKEVSRQTGISVDEIKSDRRTAKIVAPRHIAMTLCKQLTLRSFPEIGRMFGNRDHSTVIHAVDKYEEVLAVLDATIPKGSPIAVWVSAFIEQLKLTPAKPRKQYTKKADQ